MVYISTEAVGQPAQTPIHVERNINLSLGQFEILLDFNISLVKQCYVEIADKMLLLSSANVQADLHLQCIRTQSDFKRGRF